jgi:hypothetical protein
MIGKRDVYFYFYFYMTQMIRPILGPLLRCPQAAVALYAYLKKKKKETTCINPRTQSIECRSISFLSLAKQ